MKIAQLKLVNFRSYRNITVDFSDDFNVLIGKNDIGKSTILEAMEIFFNNEVVKVDIDDCNVFSEEKTMSIQLSLIPEKTSYTIDTIPTNFSDEYLLDENRWITIKKTWDCSKGKLTASSLKTTLISNYPDSFVTPLVNLKITDLRKLLTDEYSKILNVDEVKKNTSSQIRQAIYNTTENIILKEREIDIDKEDGKKYGLLYKVISLSFSCFNLIEKIKIQIKKFKVH